MIFNSLVFVIFAAIFYAAWPFAKKAANFRWLFLVVASFVFYGWWDWRYLSLLVFSGILDYYAAKGMVKFPGYKKLFLIISMIGNLGSLGLFKYSGFAAENIDLVLSYFGADYSLSQYVPAFMLTIPVGISFYTFQSMSYTIDVYRGELKPTGKVLHFFAYLSMFPQLVAGPIVRARDLLPQLAETPEVDESMRWKGTRLIIVGYFKKMLIADNVGMIIAMTFANPADYYETTGWWLVMIGFAIQIYCDFSGYSDIARGLANWMGYEFPLNFNHPYYSRSVREFWGRWHISLSTWFRDYVYIPLGGNKGGTVRAHVRMWLTMVTSGLWHGPAWTFVIWGALNAAYISFERVIGRHKRPIFKKLWLQPALWAFCMVQVIFAWVFFRASSLPEAVLICKRMVCFEGPLIPAKNKMIVLYILILLVVEIVTSLSTGLKRKDIPKFAKFFEPLFYAVLLALAIVFHGPAEQFIYFQF